jgi:hypothetical protein
LVGDAPDAFKAWLAGQNGAGNLAEELVEMVKATQLFLEPRVFAAGDGGHGLPSSRI